MASEIIDLTVSPVPIYTDLDADEKHSLLPPSVQLGTVPDAEREREKKRSRRKKRKRGWDNHLSATHTREHSTDEEVARVTLPNRRDIAVENQRLSKNPRFEEQNSNEKITYRSPSPNLQENTPCEDAADFFYIDTQPAPLSSISLSAAPPPETQDKSSPTLLLPLHVSVLGTEPVEILPPDIVESDEDYIEYLDLDERKDLVRYFEDPQEENTKKTNRTVCKNCGTEGDHKTAACPVLICLTCGARNEHSTRSCPISKTCFTCGMKGHINATCPNRKATRVGNLNKFDDCDRCGSRLHKTNECPTLWRLYEYLTEDGKDYILQLRKSRQNLSLGQGGEGYIADDEWCYNCGNCGHWGDDCQDIPHQGNLPNESSAFSIHNTLSGPFFDSVTKSKSLSSRRREPRDWEQSDALYRDWGSNVPENVGRQGRRNNIAKMEKRAQEQVVEDDPDDWFGNSRNVRSHGALRNTEDKAPTTHKKITFSKSFQDSGRQFHSHLPTPSLLDRLSDKYDHDRPHSRHHERSSRNSERSFNSQDDKYGRRHDRDRHRRREEPPGPRYKGGYLR